MFTRYNYFKEHYYLLAIDFSKQQALDTYPKEIQWANCTGNLDRVESATMFLIIAEAKRNHFRFFTRNFESVVTLFLFLIKYKYNDSM